MTPILWNMAFLMCKLFRFCIATLILETLGAEVCLNVHHPTVSKVSVIRDAVFPQTVLAPVGVLADLVENRWSGVTPGQPGVALKT